MHSAFPIVMGLALLAVLGTLIAGVLKMGNPRRSNKFMQWRVALQAVALAILALFFIFGR